VGSRVEVGMLSTSILSNVSDFFEGARGAKLQQAMPLAGAWASGRVLLLGFAKLDLLTMQDSFCWRPFIRRRGMR